MHLYIRPAWGMCLFRESGGWDWVLIPSPEYSILFSIFDSVRILFSSYLSEYFIRSRIFDSFSVESFWFGKLIYVTSILLCQTYVFVFFYCVTELRPNIMGISSQYHYQSTASSYLLSQVSLWDKYKFVFVSQTPFFFELVFASLCFHFLGAWWRWAIISSTTSVTCNCAFPFCIFCVCFPVFVCLFVFVFTLYLIECARVLCHIGGDNPGPRHLLLQMFVLPLSI